MRLERAAMKAELKKDGTLFIVAENYAEAYALKYIFPNGNECHHCENCRRIIIDCSILIKDED